MKLQLSNLDVTQANNPSLSPNQISDLNMLIGGIQAVPNSDAAQFSNYINDALGDLGSANIDYNYFFGAGKWRYILLIALILLLNRG